MGKRIITCRNCGSEMWWPSRKPCGNCHGLTAEEDAIRRAREAFAQDRIDIGELEHRIAQALRNPPAPSWAGITLVFR